MAINSIDVNAVAKGFQDEVGDAVAKFFKAELTARAKSAQRRKRIIRSHGHTYNYARYQNTGQLANAINIKLKDGHRIVNDGTRSNYTHGYHGMYFLKEKKGMSDIKTTLKKGAEYTKALKL